MVYLLSERKNDYSPNSLLHFPKLYHKGTQRITKENQSSLTSELYLMLWVT